MKEPTEFQDLKAWLLFFLIATVGDGLIAMVLGSFLAAFLGAGGMPLAQMDRTLKILGVVIGIPISYVTFRAGYQRPNQSMKPTAPDRVNVSRLATAPCRGLSLSR